MEGVETAGEGASSTVLIETALAISGLCIVFTIFLAKGPGALLLQVWKASTITTDCAQWLKHMHRRTI